MNIRNPEIQLLCKICSTLALLFCMPVHAQDDPEEPFPIPSAGSSFELLFLGNSHSAANGLPSLVELMIEQGTTGANAAWQLAPGYRFLEERLTDNVSLPLLTSRHWTHVILQAQKYSSSGLYDYPTTAAEEFIRRAKTQGAVPIMFPEWPRRGNTEEGRRVHELHLEIASRESACVAPVGLAWEASIASRPALDLHAPDGNHSNLAGAVLTAYVLYEVLTGQAAQNLPLIPALGVTAEIQQHLKTIASSTVTSDAQGCQPVQVSSIPGIPALGPLGLMLLVAFMAPAAALKLPVSHITR